MLFVGLLCLAYVIVFLFLTGISLTKWIHKFFNTIMGRTAEEETPDVKDARQRLPGDLE